MTQRIVTIGPFTRIIQNSFLQQSIMLILAGMETSIIKYLGVKQKIIIKQIKKNGNGKYLKKGQLENILCGL